MMLRSQLPVAAFRERPMQLEGIHHITAITGDAPRNVDFYTRVLGLRLVKKTVNQDDPSVYHLFYGDEEGSPGLDLTFFECPGAARGRAGAGMVHRILWRVAGPEAIAFWARRLEAEGVDMRREDGRLLFADPEGLGHELVVPVSGDAPLVARHPEIPADVALQGFEGVRAYGADPAASERLLSALGFRAAAEGYEARGRRRGAVYVYDRPPEARGLQGAGTVHHVAWSSTIADHAAWRERVAAGGGRPTPVIDRFYFRSIYFREPSGVLFEIATMGPGFAVDEPQESLGERLSLPPGHEHLRERLERVLTPLPPTRPPGAEA
jgi:glyoxalase family protein